MAKQAAKKQEVAVKQESVPAVLSELDNAFIMAAGQGTEEITTDEMQVPFIVVLQKLSPQVDKEEDEYIEGAEPGMLFNNVTHDLYTGADGLLFIPVKFGVHYIEFISRDNGSGFVADHGNDPYVLDNTDKNDKGQDIRRDNGNQIVKTNQYFGYVFNPANGELSQAIFPMTSTKLKKSRRWNNLIKSQVIKDAQGNKYPAPAWYNMYRITTVSQENAKGKFYNVEISLEGSIRDLGNEMALAIHNQATGFIDLIEGGRVKGAQDATTANTTVSEDDIPFE